MFSQRHTATILLFLTLTITQVVAKSPAPSPSHPDTPSFGNWKGFHPGAFVVGKTTYRNLKGHSDGIEYFKTVLVDVSTSGAACFFGFKSNHPEGPWIRGIGGHGDVAEDLLRAETKVIQTNLPDENLFVKTNRFVCSVEHKVITDDWGVKTSTAWSDVHTRQTITREETYRGQNRDGEPLHWELSLKTIGSETIGLNGRELSCLIQEQTQKLGQNHTLRWIFVVSPDVPSQLVSSKHWDDDSTYPKIETEVITWGYNPDLLAEVKELQASLGIVSDDDIQRQRKAEIEKNRQEVDALIKKTLADLDSPNVRKRLSAVNCLSQWQTYDSNEQTIMDGLKNRLSDPDPSVRRQAFCGLGMRGEKGLTAQILEQIQQDPDGTYKYIEALGFQGDPAGLPTLVSLTRSTNQFWRKAAVYSLREFNCDEAREALYGALNDPYWGVSHQAIQALGTIGTPESALVLTKALTNDNPLIVRSAISTIAKLGHDDSVPSLLNLLMSTNDLIRQTTCIYLGQMTLRDATPATDALIKCLSDSSAQVRAAAIASLGQLREKRAVPFLLEIVESPLSIDDERFGDPGMQTIIALGRIGTPSAISRLIELLNDPQLQALVFIALSESDERVAAPLFDHYTRTKTHSRTDQTLRIIGKLGNNDMVPRLQEYLAHCAPAEKGQIRNAIDKIQQRERDNGTE